AQDFGNGLAYAFRRRRLGNESGSPEIERTADHMRILACRNDDHGNAWILRAQVHQARQPLYAGHAKIEQHQVALLRLLEEGDGLVESASLVDLEIFEITGQCLPEGIAEQGMVVRDDYLVSRHEPKDAPSRPAPAFQGRAEMATGSGSRRVETGV